MMCRICAFIVCMLLACTSAHAADNDAPRTMLRAHLEPSGPVVAGSTMKLVVDALTTTWFSDAPDWPLFDMPNAFVTLPEDSALNLNETIDGVQWFGVRRAYRIVPRAAGVLQVPSFRITLHPGGGASNKPVILDTPSFEITATWPPGAEGLRAFLPAPNVTATQRIEPADGKLEVGSTITRIVTQRADATESMMIPPVKFTDIDGLRSNAKQPVTRNVTQGRGELVAGERVDTITYVISRRGRFTLPALEIEWWNTVARHRETIVLPAMTFTAHAAHEKPLWEIPADALNGAARHTVIFLNARDLVIACIVLALIVTGVAWYSRLRAWLARMSARMAASRKRRAEGEPAAWRALKHAVQSRAMSRIVPALYRWMDAGAQRPAQLTRIEDDAQLKPLAQAVVTHYAPATRDDAAPSVRLHRRTGWRRARRKPDDALPPLNGFP
jgi:hypothetical protein